MLNRFLFDQCLPAFESSASFPFTEGNQPYSSVSIQVMLMRIDVRRTAASMAVALVMAGCGPFRHGNYPEASVVFHNQSTDQADVYAISSGGEPVRIGTVFAGRTDRLTVPQSATGASNRVNVMARIFGLGRVITTGPVTLAPGETMDVTLSSDEKILSVLPSRGN